MTNGKQKFVNQIPTAMDMGIKATMTMLRDFIRGNPNRQPASPIPTKPFYCDDIPDPERTQVTWFGHSAFLLEIEGKRLLFDPMLADTPSPFPLFGGKRYSRTLPIERDKFPFIDAVVMSHDHYDHLDYHSIRALKDRVGRFFVPLGVRNRLVKWGVDPAKVTEHNWWSEIEFNGLTLACTPARHFSGRGIFGRNTTLSRSAKLASSSGSWYRRWIVLRAARGSFGCLPLRRPFARAFAMPSRVRRWFRFASNSATIASVQEQLAERVVPVAHRTTEPEQHFALA